MYFESNNLIMNANFFAHFFLILLLGLASERREHSFRFSEHFVCLLLLLEIREPGMRTGARSEKKERAEEKKNVLRCVQVHEVAFQRLLYLFSTFVRRSSFPIESISVHHLFSALIPSPRLSAKCSFLPFYCANNEFRYGNPSLETLRSAV